MPGIFDIASFDMIPWGNAYFNGTSGDQSYCQTKNEPPACNSRNGRSLWLDKCGATAPNPLPKVCWEGVALCQHGPNECKANLLENCAIQMYPDPDQTSQERYPEFWDIVACYENTTIGRDPILNASVPIDNMRDCMAKLGYSEKGMRQLEECAEGETGKDYEQNAASRTASSSKGHGGTPYITVDGHPTSARDVLREVCQRYRGDLQALPLACFDLRLPAGDPQASPETESSELAS